MQTILVPNTLRSQKLASVVDAIVTNVQNGGVVLVRNEKEYTNAVVEAVEKAKQELSRRGIRVFQSNKLDQTEAYNETDPAQPLKQPKIHHYKVNLSIKLSDHPIDDAGSDETQQITAAPSNQQQS